jgi:hypothetical protein
MYIQKFPDFVFILTVSISIIISYNFVSPAFAAGEMPPLPGQPSSVEASTLMKVSIPVGARASRMFISLPKSEVDAKALSTRVPVSLVPSYNVDELETAVPALSKKMIITFQHFPELLSLWRELLQDFQALSSRQNPIKSAIKQSLTWGDLIFAVIYTQVLSKYQSVKSRELFVDVAQTLYDNLLKGYCINSPEFATPRPLNFRRLVAPTESMLDIKKEGARFEDVFGPFKALLGQSKKLLEIEDKELWRTIDQTLTWDDTYFAIVYTRIFETVNLNEPDKKTTVSQVLNLLEPHLKKETSFKEKKIEDVPDVNPLSWSEIIAIAPSGTRDRARSKCCCKCWYNWFKC